MQDKSALNILLLYTLSKNSVQRSWTVINHTVIKGERWPNVFKLYMEALLLLKILFDKKKIALLIYIKYILSIFVIEISKFYSSTTTWQNTPSDNTMCLNLIMWNSETINRKLYQ